MCVRSKLLVLNQQNNSHGAFDVGAGSPRAHEVPTEPLHLWKASKEVHLDNSAAAGFTVQHVRAHDGIVTPLVNILTIY